MPWLWLTIIEFLKNCLKWEETIRAEVTDNCKQYKTKYFVQNKMKAIIQRCNFYFEVYI